MVASMCPALAWCAVCQSDVPHTGLKFFCYNHAEIMKLHHGAHHKTYVTNLNSTYEQYQSAESKTDVPKMIQLQQAIKFNGGGRSELPF